MKLSTLTLLALGLVVIAAAPALAYHDGGVAHCNGCHTMHNSQNGVAMNFNATGTGPGTPVGTGYNDLLLFVNKSDVCLNCHAGSGSYHVWSDDALAPTVANRGGGDFVFLEEDNLNDGHGGGDGVCSGGGHDNETDCVTNGWVWTWDEPIPGEAAGHTLASGIKGTMSDMTLTTAPGGTYSASDLSCTSCHDPHGNDAFRLLYKDGQNNGSGVAFTSEIDATGTSLFGPHGTDGNHNVYRAGYSEWCAECHGDFHAASAALIHPSGELLDSEQVTAYNAYAGSTDCAMNPPAGGNPCGSGVKATAYKAAVPIEQGAAFAGGTNSTEGATDGASGVACVSCHRAHASSGPDAGRWDFNVTGLEEDGHESGSYKIPNAYAGDTSQRSLCNKCHSQDEFDEIIDFTP